MRFYLFTFEKVGQTGSGTSSLISSPQLLPFDNNRIIKICSSYQHSIILRGDGKVFTFGNNQV
jgi:alpha-tubulin suppressor-like RCC1 family protein